MEGGRVSDEDTKDEPYDMCEDAEEAECPSVRFHTIVPGNIKNYIIDFKTRLAACSEVTEVSSTKWSDVTLVFCPIVSRVGTDIEAALRDVEDSKPCILVAMHHTFDPEYVMPDSRRFGRSKNVLIVDCLFHEELGLLKCESNEEAHQVIMNHLKEEQEKKIPAQQLEDTKSLDTSGVASGCEAIFNEDENETQANQIPSEVTGQEIKDSNKEVNKEEQNVLSEKELNAEATPNLNECIGLNNQMLNEDHAEKEQDEVQTDDTNKTETPPVPTDGTARKSDTIAKSEEQKQVSTEDQDNTQDHEGQTSQMKTPDPGDQDQQDEVPIEEGNTSEERVKHNKQDTEITVFPGEKYEIKAGEPGLVSTTWSWIQNQMLWSAVTNPGCETRLYTLVPDKVKKECTTLLTKLDAKKPTKATEVSSLEECDVILAFCPIVTRLGTDIEAALMDIPDTKPGILVVMHFTFDPDYVIPNSSRFVQERDIVTVDLLFNKDVGLIECEHNSQAVDKLGKSLKNCEKTSQDPVPSNENTDRGEQTSTEEQHGIETTASTERSVEPEDAKEQQQILSQTFWSTIEYLGSTIRNIVWQFWTAEEQPVSTSYSESSEGAAT